MNLVKKEKEINIDGEEFIMTFDMRSLAVYKELSNKPFTLGVHELFKYDDNAIIMFIASTLRRKEEVNRPLGREVLEGDILYFLMAHGDDVIDLIVKSLPSDNTENSKKK